MKFVNATQLELGESGTIERVEPNENRGKLFELGFIDGTIIMKTHVSFNGLSICFTLNNTTFALRKTDARHIMVSQQ